MSYDSEKSSKYYSDKISLGFIFNCAAVAIVAVGAGFIIRNSSEYHERVHQLKNAADAACTVPGNSPVLKKILHDNCVSQTDKAIDGIKSHFDKHTLFVVDFIGEQTYARANNYIQTDVANFARFKYAQMSALEDQKIAIASRVRAIVFDGQTPYAISKIDVKIESIAPVLLENDKKPKYLANFSITVVDADNPGTSISYDHGDGVIIWGDSAAIQFGNGQSIFDKNGRVDKTGGYTDSCRGNERFPCLVIATALQALNDLPAVELERMRAEMQELAVANVSRSDKMTVDNKVYGFPDISLSQLTQQR